MQHLWTLSKSCNISQFLNPWAFSKSPKKLIQFGVFSGYPDGCLEDGALLILAEENRRQIPLFDKKLKAIQRPQQVKFPNKQTSLLFFFSVN